MSDDEIEEMVRDAIDLHAVDEEARTAAVRWLNNRIAICQAMEELGLISVDDLDNEAAA